MAITGSSVSHLAQAPIEVAVRAALAERGRFDRDDVERATAYVMTSLSPDTLRAIAANPTGSQHLLQAVIPSATANIAVNTREARNWHGPAGDPSRFGTGRTWAGRFGADFYLAAFGDSDGEGGSGTSGSSLRYVGMDISKVNSHNYTSTDFHRHGIDYGTFSELRSQGFSGQNILSAARDADRLGFRGNPQMVRNQALIQRYDTDAAATVSALENFRTRLRGNQEYGALVRELQTASPERRAQIEARMAAIRQETRGESGVQGRLDANPESTPAGRGAREGINGAEDLIIRDTHEHFRRAAPVLTVEQSLSGRQETGLAAQLDDRQRAIVAGAHVQSEETIGADLLAAANVHGPTPAVVHRADAQHVEPRQGQLATAQPAIVQPAAPRLTT